MDAIDILFSISLLYSLVANLSAAQKGFKDKLTKAVYKPVTYLQKIPPNISASILVMQIVGIFKIGVIEKLLAEEFYLYRIIALLLYIISAYLQVKSFKNLGKFYSPDIVIMQNHELITKGIHSKIRHPQYLFQLLSDFFAAVVLMSYFVGVAVLLIETPLFVLRAKREEEMMLNHFKESYANYKSKSGFFLPF